MQPARSSNGTVPQGDSISGMLGLAPGSPGFRSWAEILPHEDDSTGHRFHRQNGNGYVVNKLMTTRFPLCAIVDGAHGTSRAAQSWMEAEWTPRDWNQEADDLSNVQTRRRR